MSRRLLPSKLDTKPRRKRNSTVERTRLDNSKTKETKEDLKSPSEVFTILSSSKSSKLGNTGNVINVHPNIPSTVNETDSINKENNSVHSQALQSKSEQSDIESVWTARTAENSDNTLEKVRLEENNRASKERIKIKNLDESSGDIYSRRIPLPALKPFQLNALGDSQINCDIQNREIGVPPTKSVIKKKDPPCASQFFWPRSPISNKSTESGIKIFLDSVEDDSPSKEVVSHLKAPLCRLSQADTDSTNELHKESSDTSPMKPDKSQSKISEAGQASNKENNNEGCNETKTAGPSDKLADNDLSPHNASKTLNAYSPSCTSKIPLHPHDESTISIHPEEDALSIMKDKSSRGEEASQEITEEELNSGSTVSSGTQHYSPFYEKNEMLSPSFSGDDDSVLKCSGKHIQSQKNSDCDDDGLSWVNRPMLSLQERTQDIDVRQGRENIIEKRTGKMELNPLSPPPAIRKTNDVGYNDRVSSLRTRDKSMESEVEGVIKDLLFLGNENMSKPGRREQIEEPIFSPTHETASVDTDAISSSSSISRSAASSLVCQDDEETGNDPVITILSGVSAALSEAFGIQLEDDGDDSDDFSESAASTIAFSSIKNAMNVGNAVNYATEKILRPAAAEAVDIILGSNDDAPKKRRPRKGGESRSLLLPEIDDSIASHNMKKNHKSREKLSIRPKSKTGDTAFGPSGDIGKANTRRQLKKSYLSGIIAPTETDHVLANPHHNDPTCFPHKRSYLVEKAKTVHMTFGPLEDAEKIEKKRELGIKYTNQNVASAGTHGVLAEPSHSCVVSARFIKETYPWKEDSNSIKSTTLLDPMIRKQLQVPSLKERKSRETSRRYVDQKDIAKSVSGSLTDKPLEDDPRLADLALHTAQSIHNCRGVELNRSTDFFSELEFQIVQVAMPLGVLLQNNLGGCWVAEVFPYGNAMNCLEVGDQIAAIDGRSAIQMTVEDICDLLLRISKERDEEEDNLIELTVLRYTGELHPMDNEIPAKITTTTRTAPNEIENSPNGNEHNIQEDLINSSSDASTEAAHNCTGNDAKKKRFQQWFKKRPKRKTSQSLVPEN